MAVAVGALAVLSTVLMPSAVTAQVAESGSDVVRIVARKLADDRLEFGIQQQDRSGSWNERTLPRLRFFPAGATIDRWLQSSPLTVSVPAGAGSSAADVEVRIVARRLANGKVEFALRKRLADGSWSGTLLPRARLFPATATVGRWLSSTPISVLTSRPSTSTAPSTSGAPARFTALEAGILHTCGVRSDNSVVCWGDNADGQSNVPVGSYTAVVAGDQHTCGLRTDGTVTCWGWNRQGQAVAPVGGFVAVTAGRWHSCGLETGGTVSCWGGDSYGQRSNVPAGEFNSIAAGRAHTCGLRPDGSVECWGRNPAEDFGQHNPPDDQFRALSAGDLYTCGLRTDGTITCWGSNSDGQLNVPAGRFSALSAARDHSCGVRTDGTVSCWGNNDQAQSDPPSGRFSFLATGLEHSCGVETDGTVTC